MPGKATVFVQIHQKLFLAHITTATKKYQYHPMHRQIWISCAKIGSLTPQLPIINNEPLT